MSNIDAQLENEKMRTIDLEDVINAQRHQLDEATSNLQALQLKHAELESKIVVLTSTMF